MFAERVFKLFYMPNYKLEELLAKSNDEVCSIAQTLGLSPKQTDSLQDIAYMIIDEQAIQNAQNLNTSRRGRRPRIGEDTAKVADKKTAAASKKKIEPKVEIDTANESAQAVADNPADGQGEEMVEASAPKRRGRPRKEAAQPKIEAASVEEAPAEAPAPKRRGRPRKETAQAEKQEVEQSSLFDEQTTTPVEQPKEEAQVEEQPAVQTIVDEDSDFIIIQDIPAAETMEQLLNDEQQPAGVAPIANQPKADDESAVTQMTDAVASQERKDDYAASRVANQSYDFGEAIIGSGVLEITAEGQGFLRSADYNYLSSPDDIFVSPQLIKAYGLKMGDVVEGPMRTPRDVERVFCLLRVDKINGLAPDKVRDRLSFEHLTPLFPNEKFKLCKGDSSDSLSARVVDLFAPIGKGQRALLVAQPKTGKTMLMKSIANAIADNHPEAYLMMLLIDERPEEVTDMARTVKAEVVASTFDEPASNHVRIAGIVLEKAKRIVECGHDVVIFLDSITRLARAYNTVAPASGKILTGGVDANALQKPKRFFGAARNIEGGGSLTIIATALIDTGSRMDEVIFEEFKGTGNMELQLDRTLSNKRIFPAVNCVASSTRRDDLLHDKMTLDRMWVLRNHIAEMTAMEAMNIVKDRMERSENNDEFLLAMNS